VFRPFLVDVFYRDFFEAPKHTSSRLRPSVKGQSDSEGRVRFHDEVRVKKIKAKGKNLPLSFLYENGVDNPDDMGSGPEDDLLDVSEGLIGDGSGNGDEVGGETVSQDLDLEQDNVGGELVSQDPDSEEDNMTVVERLKDDLFADAEDNHTDAGA